jgi:hypothetical protein
METYKINIKQNNDKRAHHNKADKGKTLVILNKRNTNTM